MIAFDLGASSGRAVLGRLIDGKIEMTELHRFSNDPVQVGQRLHWDILRLYHEIKQALMLTKHIGVELSSIGIDAWAVDFGFIGPDGELVGNPYHYRDQHTENIMGKVFAEVPASEIFATTGIQFLQFNSLFQLYALKQAGSSWLKKENRLLMIPDLLRYFLTGEMHHEFTNATTTQLFNPRTGDWDYGLLAQLGLHTSWLGNVLQPGSNAGTLRASVCDELGIPSIPVYAVAEHDTASAVVAVPATDRSFAYVCCGTWSLMGTEVQEPVINQLSQDLNYTNEGGAFGTYRLLKNIMGLWLLQESRRAWENDGVAYDYSELMRLAGEAAPFRSFIDPDDHDFLAAGDMPSRIARYCERTGQQASQSVGETVR